MYTKMSFSRRAPPALYYFIRFTVFLFFAGCRCVSVRDDLGFGESLRRYNIIRIVLCSRRATTTTITEEEKKKQTTRAYKNKKFGGFIRKAKIYSVLGVRSSKTQLKRFHSNA